MKGSRWIKGGTMVWVKEQKPERTEGTWGAGNSLMRCEGRMGGDEPVRLVVPHQRKLVCRGGSVGFVI